MRVLTIEMQKSNDLVDSKRSIVTPIMGVSRRCRIVDAAVLRPIVIDCSTAILFGKKLLDLPVALLSPNAKFKIFFRD